MNTDDIRIRYAALADFPGATRRERERAAVSAIIARELPHGARLEHLPNGAPVLARQPLLSISISHSRSHAVVAFGPVTQCFGIDLEEPRKQLRRVAPRLLSDLDIPGPLTASDDDLLHAWTAKEAVYKALRATALPLVDIVLDLPNLSATAAGASFALDFRPGPDGQLLCLAVKR